MTETTCRRSSGECAIYAFDPRPGSLFFAVLVSPEEYAAVMERGWATLDGIRATPMPDECDEGTGFMRFQLERPYEVPK